MVLMVLLAVLVLMAVLLLMATLALHAPVNYIGYITLHAPVNYIGYIGITYPSEPPLVLHLLPQHQSLLLIDTGHCRSNTGTRE